MAANSRRINESRIDYIHFSFIIERLLLFSGFGKKNKNLKSLRCAVCSKELLRHKYKPSPNWNIKGLLCSDCHFEKTRDFILNAEREKEKESKRKELQDRTCRLCNSIIGLDHEKKKPNWKWGMDSETVLCTPCYDKMEADFERKKNFCAICDKKIGFFRYNPKQKWRIDGQLCRQCWDNQNMKGKISE
jgi:hypothetical protein